jgi:hypothetical protein
MVCVQPLLAAEVAEAGATSPRLPGEADEEDQPVVNVVAKKMVCLPPSNLNGKMRVSCPDLCCGTCLFTVS